jgi:HPt (histidine-containing phosphotransfer) domain-containing protein
VARHAHTIAGASGNLGADALRAAAKTLEHAAREGSGDVAPLLADVEARAAVVSRSIDSLRAPVAPVGAGAVAVSAPTPVPTAARPALERLHTALGDFDASAASIALADLASVAMADAPDALNRLREHVDRYEYEEAKALSAQLLDKGSEVS